MGTSDALTLLTTDLAALTQTSLDRKAATMSNQPNEIAGGLHNGKGRVTPEDLRNAAGVRSNGDAGLMAAAADEIEHLIRIINE